MGNNEMWLSERCSAELKLVIWPDERFTSQSPRGQLCVSAAGREQPAKSNGIMKPTWDHKDEALSPTIRSAKRAKDHRGENKRFGSLIQRLMGKFGA